MIKAIETRYKGYRFRSRLEARWAIFFDAISMKWRYESEGYRTDNKWYLPDFVLLDREVRNADDFSYVSDNLFIEVKPKHPTTADWEKGYSLAKNSGQPVYMTCGDPWFDVPIFCLAGGAPLDFRRDDHLLLALSSWAECADCQDIGLIPRWYMQQGRPCPDCSGTLSTHTVKLQRAYVAARSARFEHGETP